MRLALTSAPAALLTTAEAKAHLRLEHSDDDTLVDALVAAATRHAETFTGRAFVTQTWTLTLDEWPCDDVIVLPRPPLVSVSSVVYRASDGTATTLTVTTDYQVVGAASESNGRIAPAYGTSWPSLRGGGSLGDVVVTFVAGYGAASAVPADMKHAVRLLVGALYEQREDFVTGTIVNAIPLAAERLLGPYRAPTALVAAA